MSNWVPTPNEVGELPERVQGWVFYKDKTWIREAVASDFLLEELPPHLEWSPEPPMWFYIAMLEDRVVDSWVKGPGWHWREILEKEK